MILWVDYGYCTVVIAIAFPAGTSPPIVQHHHYFAPSVVSHHQPAPMFVARSTWFNSHSFEFHLRLIIHQKRLSYTV